MIEMMSNLKKETARQDKEWWTVVKKKETLIRNVFLLKGYFNNHDLVEHGITATRQGASRQMDWFVKQEIILKKYNGYVLAPKAFDEIDRLLPAFNEAEKISIRRNQ
jgi:tRNA A37 N6-isopentenylltransferase MiaA